MATGGTIPSKRQQTVTFYNTTGIIERNKNIYLAPRFSKHNVSAGTKVCSAYLAILNVVCPPSSQYTSIEVSGWSPQDRNLRVKGNIDDFRLVTEEGDCLNYFILTRTVTKVENNVEVARTYYYGFFITGVQQDGGSSVLLTVQPDDLTNVFYLHNSHALTALEISNDYEPFNEKMKNCYVNRQHYDRVKYVRKTITHTDHYEGSSSRLTIPTGLLPVQLFNINLSHTGSVTNESHTFTIELGSGSVSVSYTISDNVMSYVIRNEGEEELKGTLTYSFDIVWEEQVMVLEPANMKVFLNQEETYRYKYQYKDLKYPYRLTKEDYEEIMEEDDFSNLSSELKRKILLSSINYLVVETKSIEMVVHYKYLKVNVGSSSLYYIKHVRNGNLISDGFNRPNVVLVYPFMDIPDIFAKYKASIDVFIFKGYFSAMEKYSTLTSASNVLDILNKKAVADYVYSAYIVRDVLIPDSKISVDYVNYSIIYEATTPDFEIPTTTITHKTARFQTNIYYGGLADDPDYIDSQDSNLHEITIQFGSTTNPDGKYFDSQGCALGLVVSGYDKKNININLSEEIPNLTTSYWDNILEAEPYSFYSVSYLSYELVFNKNRYFISLDSQVNISYYLSVNGAIKSAIIPNYSVEGKENPYFNEGLIFTIDSSVPLVTDSYSSYYYQNKAQMKNQFAVNDMNRGTDLAQHFFVSGPNSVGMGASKRGGYGALAETGYQVMQMVDEAIDWVQSNKEIEMNQKARLADIGRKPDNIKQTGSDSLFDISTNENNYFINHYVIDTVSYNSIAKLFERTGYQINLYDSLHTMDRVGWNFLKLNSFDFIANITVAQETSIRKILTEGVTLLHDKTYLTAGHNFETILEGGD